MADDNSDWSLYPYTPSKAAPICFAVLLTCIAIYQIYLSFFRYAWKKFGGTMTWATSVWIGGFVCRAISVRQLQNVQIFIAQYVLVLMGPPLYAASEYFILGRLFAYLPYHTSIHPGRIISTFLFLSAAVEALTANGAARSIKDDPAERAAGLACLKSALVLQCFVEALFFSLVVSLEYRSRRSQNFPRQLRPVFYVLYITSLMMLVRCIVRAIDGFKSSRCISSGYCGYISLHEWTLWVFEIANITLFVILLTVFHPGKYLPRSSKIYLDPLDGKTERLGPGFGKADKRPFLLTVADPFNLVAVCTGRGGHSIHKFWEEEHPIANSSEEQSIPLKQGARLSWRPMSA